MTDRLLGAIFLVVLAHLLTDLWALWRDGLPTTASPTRDSRWDAEGEWEPQETGSTTPATRASRRWGRRATGSGPAAPSFGCVHAELRVMGRSYEAGLTVPYRVLVTCRGCPALWWFARILVPDAEPGQSTSPRPGSPESVQERTLVGSASSGWSEQPECSR